jgi:hypothetical protein
MALALGTGAVFDTSAGFKSGDDCPGATQTTGDAGDRRHAVAQAHADEAVESGSDGFTVRPSLEAGSKKRKWTGTEEVQHHWLTATTKEIELDWCVWDLHCQYGQTRSLHQGYVGRLKAILEERPPTAPVRVSVWENTADRQYYSRSGLHIGGAVKNIRDERDKHGWAPQRRHTHVCTDVLKCETPLRQRQRVAGASNAGTSRHRTTGNGEHLRQVLKLKSEPDLGVHGRILGAPGQYGLNVTGTSPVCVR